MFSWPCKVQMLVVQISMVFMCEKFEIECGCLIIDVCVCVCVCVLGVMYHTDCG